MVSFEEAKVEVVGDATKETKKGKKKAKQADQT